MVAIKLLAAAGDWAAGDVVRVDTKRAEKLIRTGYAEPVSEAPAAPVMGLRGAKRKEKVH